MRAQNAGAVNGSTSEYADSELRVDCPHPLDSSRPLPKGEVFRLIRRGWFFRVCGAGVERGLFAACNNSIVHANELQNRASPRIT